MSMQVIPFTRRSPALLGNYRPTEPATIIIFPGVRYERTDATAPNHLTAKDVRLEN